MKNEFINWYIDNRPAYKHLATKVEVLLRELFDSNDISYHMITSRAKTVESVKGKVAGGKYENPKKQIHDFTGIRVITYVEDEIDEICKIIEEIFEINSEHSSNKSDDLGIDKVGYKSVHYVASLDQERLKLPEYRKFSDKCFEIQVRTILQHAWAEIEHDRNYKFSGKLPPTLGRRFKILAGVLEMADREFNDISNQIDLISESTKESTAKGNYDIPLSSTTLSKFLESRFSSLWSDGFQLVAFDTGQAVAELERFGIKTLEDLNNIIPNDFETSLRELGGKSILDAPLAIRIMVTNDYHKYFGKAAHDDVWIWMGQGDPTESAERKFFEKYGVDWDDIYEKYGARLVEAEELDS
ncbi:GTP pyrophosphokinase [Enterovibrio norvegicus]|uniref:GTP pyrophosphokinase n=1 Tax=Enterovibrio norvegicus TaxID=188144 RepID=UPI0013D76BB4|nr:hypothetical protein [Enterovibrio norvegicus]